MIHHLTGLGKTQNTTAAVRVDNAQEAALARGQERLSDLSNGQTLQGKVMSVSTAADGVRTVQVDIGDGAFVNARLSGNMQLSAGQEISFSVRSNTEGGSVTLRPLYANMAADSNSMKALSQAGLAVTGDTTAMVREMMSAGMSIDRASLLQVGRNVMAYPGHATSIVQMTDLGIPVTPGNIEQFENYKNFEHQVMHSIDAIMEDLPEAFRALSQTGNTGEALDLYGELLTLFSGEEGLDEAAVQESAQEGTAGAKAAQTDVTEADPSGARVIAETGMSDPDAAEAASVQSGKASAARLSDDPSQTTQAVRDENMRSSSLPGTEQNKVLEAAMKALTQAADASSAETSGISAGARTQGFQALLRELNIPEQVIAQATQSGEGNAAQAELLKALADAWKQTGHRDAKTDATWSKLFSSKEMGGILKEAIAKDWLLKPSDVEKKENVQSLYDRLQNQTAKLSQILSGRGMETKLAENVQNLRNNLSFMNDLNHMFQYVQLPLKMNGQNTHGDLYVYANKKNAMHEDGTVSAMLHLDMEHMGPVDVFVKMRDNNVKTNFYLADDEMIDFIMSHIDILNDRLAKRGYNMDARLMLKDEMNGEDAPVKEMLEGNLGRMSMLSHTSFEALA